MFQKNCMHKNKLIFTCLFPESESNVCSWPLSSKFGISGIIPMSVGIAIVGPHPSAAGEAIIGAIFDAPASIPSKEILLGLLPAAWGCSWLLLLLTYWGPPEEI